MKSIVKNHFTKQSQEIISALVLTGIFSLSTGLTLLQAATAAPKNLSQEAVKGEMVKGKGKLISQRQRERERDYKYEYDDDRDRNHERDRANQLPRSVANTVRRDLSRRVGIPPEKLKIIKYSRETWSDGCLGLGGLNELCSAALVPGWRITLSDGRSSWVYRTDLEGLVLRLEPQKASVKLPKSVADAVLQEASLQLGLPISELSIVQAEKQTWTDGCLGLGTLVELCLQALVPGWRVTVEAGQQRLVYHTNETGSSLRLNEAASQTGDAGTIKPVQIPSNELPPPLLEGVIFRQIVSGGIAGITYETNLFSDGRVIRVQVNLNGTTSQTETYRISQQQVREFRQVLKQQQSAFNGLSYPAPSGAADYFSYTLTSQAGTTIYTGINQERLPSSLQAVIEAWNQVLSSTQQ